ncbi:MAG TPA: arabinofuranosidase catalytic domain-containing protein [Actinocrinis sp.]|nr:arabinofuranosidase catalytic domain-containing protein [Actinocrinis sp.]
MYFSNTGANPTSISGEHGSFVSAWEKNNGTTNFTLKYGNGQQGGLTQFIRARCRAGTTR